MNLRALAFACLSTTVVVGAAVGGEPGSPPPVTTFAGLWETPPNIGIGSALWLSPTGEAVWASLMIDDGTYRVLGDRLVERNGIAGDDERESELGTLTQTTWSRDGGADVRQRVGASGSPTIVGVWRGERAGRTAFERYESDGKMRWRVQLEPGRGGRWAPTPDGVQVTWADGTRSVLRGTGEKLTARAGVFDDLEFGRVSVENWYALSTRPGFTAKDPVRSSDARAVGLWEATSRLPRTPGCS